MSAARQSDDDSLDDARVQPGTLVCASADLTERGAAVPFDVMYQGRRCPAFVIRFDGRVYAYLNRCAHVPMEMDMVPNHFFDHSGHYLICATHGALYQPQSGACRGGPCRGGLVPVPVTERDGQVCWHTDAHIQTPAPRS